MKFAAVIALFSSAVVLAAPQATATTSAAAATGSQIRGVSDPIYHLYLQRSSSGAPVLASEDTAGEFVISGSIQDVSSGDYLNINTSDTTSYKSLSFGSTATFTGWGLEGDTIITTTSSSYGRQLNFLACASSTDSGAYDIYLQTGSDEPSTGSCSNYQTLHLPCLC